MDDNLEHTLKKASPREKSGSRTVGRYDYQAHCGLLKLFDLHNDHADFRVVFDYFDDMLVLDSASAPKSAQLFQVKTKDSGDWSTANLCAMIGKLAPRSIVARLYDHVDVLGDSVALTSFISNAAFKVTLKDGKKSSGDHHWIAGTDLHDDDVAKIKAAVEMDISPCEMGKWQPRLVLIRSPMGVHGQKAYVIGVLHEYFTKILDLPNVNLDPLYETLYETIQQCTRFTQEGLGADELIRKKSVTRADLDAVIDRAINRRGLFLEDWPTISTDLANAGINTVRQIRLRTAALKHLADRSVGHALAGKLSDFAATWASENSSAIASATNIYDLAKTMIGDLQQAEISGDELLGAMVVEAYEAIHE